MKQTLVTIIFIAVSLLSFAQTKLPTYSITIDEFEDQKFEFFNNVTGEENPKITQKSAKDFYIAIIEDIAIDSLMVKALSGKYLTQSSKQSSTSSIQDIYIIDDPYTGGDENKILIKIFQGEEEAVITLKVEPSADGKEKDDSSPCNLFVSKTTNSDCNSNNKFFGESVEYFTDKTIVYVYDYNSDPSKRVFYKITENKKTGNLERAIVNLNKETLTIGKNVRFKIYDINKFMYDVSIADSLVQFESEPPALFNEFFLGDKEGLLGGLMETFSSGDTRAISKIKNDDAKTLLKNITCFIQNYNNLRGIALDAYNPCKTFHCRNSIDYADFLTALSQIKSQTKIVEDKLNTAKASLQKTASVKDTCFNALRLKTSIDINIKNANFSISKFDLIIEELTLQDASLKNQIDRIQRKIKSIESQMYFSSGADSLTKKAQLSRLEKELTEKKAEFTSNSSKLIEQQTKRLDLEIERNKLMNSLDSVKMEMSQACAPSAQAKMDTIDEMIYSLEISKYLIANLPSEEMLRELIIFVNNMVAQNYIHTKDYISLNGNMLDLTLSISSKDSSVVKKLTDIKVNEHIPIQIPIIWKPFVSFSSGSFIATGSHLQNKTYEWQETVGNNNTANSDSYTLVESGYTSPPMGFSALGNLQLKLCRSFGIGGSFGVGLTIENSPRLAYLVGGSLFFGDLRQLAITGGVAGMQVNKLTNNFQSITDNQVIYTSKPDIQYYNEFKVGGFISLTYTPFKVYKTKTVKSKNK